MYDSSQDFLTLITQWQNYPKGYAVLPQDCATMITAAQTALTAPGWAWAALPDLLAEHGGFKTEKAARFEAKRCQIVADLGSFPHGATEFVEAWLDSRGYTVDFAGTFLRNGKATDHDQNYVLNHMRLWSMEKRHLSVAAIEAALDVWMTDHKGAIKLNTFSALRFDANLDPHQSEIARFVRLLVAPKENPTDAGLAYRAAEVALANLIFRVKNHLRGTMRNSCHMMPVFQGKQGDGKSSAIKAFLAPLGGMSTGGSLDAFGDNDMTYQFSTMPVIIFEEMQGAAKADVTKLKNVMTEENKLMRQAYARSANRRIIATFIGSSNKDISEMIKAETGNRRFIQFETQEFDRKLLAGFDYTKMWKSVDEDADEPPMYANADDLDAIKLVQDEQRHRSPVEDWILDGDAYAIPWDKPTKAAKLWASFEEFLTDNSRGEARHWGYRRLGAVLRELAQAGRFEMKITRTGGSDSYAIRRPENTEAVPLPSFSRGDVVDLSAHRRL